MITIKIKLSNRQKLEKLYVIYENKMYALAYSILHNKAQAEDIVHDSFVKLTDYLDKIKDPDDARTKALVLKIVKTMLSIDIIKTSVKHGFMILTIRTISQTHMTLLIKSLQRLITVQFLPKPQRTCLTFIKKSSACVVIWSFLQGKLQILQVLILQQSEKDMNVPKNIYMTILLIKEV